MRQWAQMCTQCLCTQSGHFRCYWTKFARVYVMCIGQCLWCASVFIIHRMPAHPYNTFKKSILCNKKRIGGKLWFNLCLGASKITHLFAIIVQFWCQLIRNVHANECNHRVESMLGQRHMIYERKCDSRQILQISHRTYRSAVSFPMAMLRSYAMCVHNVIQQKAKKC